MMAVPPYLRSVLEAPLRGGVNTIGRALWLYLALVLRASDRGVVLRAKKRLGEDLGVSEAHIDMWLKRLLDAKLIDLQSPSHSPFLVISLRTWPRSGVVAEDFKSVARATSSPAAATATAAAAVTASAEAADVAENKNKNKQSSLRSREGGAGEGISVLADLRTVLGEADATDLEPFIADFPEEAVRKALERVRATPSRQIRKSRTALFRYLLKNSSPNTHDDTPASHPDA